FHGLSSGRQARFTDPTLLYGDRRSLVPLFPQRGAQHREALLIAPRVAEIDEVVVARVRRADALRVPDRTPVLLGAAGDLADVGEDAVRIPAVHAVQLLDAIEIREVLPIDHDVGRALYAGDAVDGKADRLVRADPEVQERDRHDQGI